MNVIYRKTKAYTPLLLKQDKRFNSLLQDGQRIGLDLATMYVSKFERAPTTFARQSLIEEMIICWFEALREISPKEEECDRCEEVVPQEETHLSNLNFQTICTQCQTEEKARPDYESGCDFVEASGYKVMYLPTTYKVVRDV